MGAWGVGIFEDDTACECLEEVMISNTVEYFEKSFEYAIATNYLEYNDCHRVTVSAAIIDIIINETDYEMEVEQDVWENWIHVYKGLNVYSMIGLAIQALEKVISEDSELNEFWIENTVGYYAWKKNIESLMYRLNEKK